VQTGWSSAYKRQGGLGLPVVVGAYLRPEFDAHGYDVVMSRGLLCGTFNQPTSIYCARFGGVIRASSETQNSWRTSVVQD